MIKYHEERKKINIFDIKNHFNLFENIPKIDKTE